MEFGTIIVGGGILGRSLGHFLKAPILEAGTRNLNTMPIGLHYLHPNKDMDSLLGSLGIKSELEEIKFGVVWFNDWISVGTLTDSQKEEIVNAYCYKTRGKYLDELPWNDKISIMDGLLGKKEFLRYGIPFSALKTVLIKETEHRVIYDCKIDYIDGKNCMIEIGKNSYHYNLCWVAAPLKSVYSKIPTPDIWAEPSYVYTFRVKKFDCPFDFVYLIGESLQADRLSIPSRLCELYDDNVIMLESRKRDIELMYGVLERLNIMPINLMNVAPVRYKRLCGNPTEYLKKLEGVGRTKAIGRYARWDNSLTLSDFLREIM